MKQMLRLSDKDFKAGIISMFLEITTNSLETSGKNWKFKEIEVIRKSQLETTEPEK